VSNHLYHRSVAPGIDYERLYEYRFRDVDQGSRQAVWDEIAPVIAGWMGRPRRVLDPAAGRGEFINAIDADERWVVDTVDHDARFRDPDVKVVIGDARTVELPADHFDAVFVSNLLEHLPTQDDVGALLAHLRTTLRPGGHIAVMGPNFRYCAKDYFDCADHVLALTHVAVAEHLYSAGYEVGRVIPRFLPYSFRSRFPASPALVRSYLRFPPAWRLLGKQFLLLGTKPLA
jgi:SAM-dependent methyltransferase